MPILTVTEARTALAMLLDQVVESHKPVTIIGKRNNAVLISEDDWRALNETLYLLGVPGMRESIIDGINTPVEECDAALEW